MTDVVSHRTVEIALEHVEGSAFESFAKIVYADLVGVDFVPLGRMHDGGADGFLDLELSESSASSKSFIQVTVRADHKTKIRQTIRRLREFGREVNSLVYITSHEVPLIDKISEELSEELNARIRIRDRQWIVANINKSPATIAAARDYLLPVVGFMSNIGAADIIPSVGNIPRAVAVFLGQELERRRRNSELLEAVTDSLILWSLEDTDPDKKRFCTSDEMLKKIAATFPTALRFIKGNLASRLQVLSSKQNPTGREIRHYRKEGKYCLPYSTREIIRRENEEDESLRLAVRRIFEERAEKLSTSEIQLSPEVIADIAIRAIHLTFQNQGLELAAFVANKSSIGEVSIADHLDIALSEAQITPRESALAKELILKLLRFAFYESNEHERLYFGKLSRTYSLLFSLQSEPRIVEYFRNMSGKFYLFVGTDILIHALSERYLRPEDQMMTNMLSIIRQSGSRLVLCEPVVEEIHAHICATDYEFRNYFESIEPYITNEIARQSAKILIRTYFYGKLTPIPGVRAPAGWRSFIEQICTYTDLHTNKGKDQIRQYLTSKYGLEHFGHKALEDLCDAAELSELSSKIESVKRQKELYSGGPSKSVQTDNKSEILAANDAKMILGVYGYRRMLGEQHTANPFGFSTWWLTQEAKIQEATVDLVQKKGGRFILRPAFILNFIALSPKIDDVRRTYENVFPSAVGLRLSNRMRDDVFHRLMNKYMEISSLDEARAKVKMGELSNSLKGDQFKRYETDFDHQYGSR